MTREEFTGWLDDIGANYEASSNGETVDVYGKGYQKVDKNGETIEFMSVVTVGGFGADRLCCRSDEFCRVSETALKEAIKQELNE